MKLLIIGAGPGGYETAVEAAKRGLEVVLVSEGPLGGTCLNEGCIPTKTFCDFAEKNGPEKDLSALQRRKSDVISGLQSGIASLLKGVEVVCGHARFCAERTVDVDGRIITADAIIIATGSVSASLPIPGAEFALDSKAVLELGETPRRLCVIGGGVIGLEFASVFASLGSQVTVLEYCPQLLPRFDTDLSKRLKASLSKRGIAIELSACVKEISADRTVSYEKNGETFSVQSDAVLMAVGRRARFEDLDLEKAGIEAGKRGIITDEHYHTSVAGVWAVGDVTGGIMLAHAAAAQGLAALDDICSIKNETDFSVIPAAVFTVPEVASIGLTEEELKQKGIPYSCGKSFYRANGKAVSMNETDGYCKVLASEEGKLLGAHIMGAHASDLIHELAVLMNFGIPVRKAASVIHAHPSLSEIVLSSLKSAEK